MRVTKEGELPAKPVYIGKCDYCKTEFEADDDEVRLDPGNQYEGQSGGYYTSCPKCLKEVYVKEKHGRN